MISKAFAMAGKVGGQGAQGAQGVEGMFMQMAPLLLMFAVAYFLLIRPQQKRAKDHRDMVSALKVGDQVVTAGGIHGKVVALQDEAVTLEVSTGVKIKFNRSSVATKV